jgi:hypothetical protein
MAWRRRGIGRRTGLWRCRAVPEKRSSDTLGTALGDAAGPLLGDELGTFVRGDVGGLFGGGVGEKVGRRTGRGRFQCVHPDRLFRLSCRIL